MPSEDREGQIQISYKTACMWNLKEDTNEPIGNKNRLVDAENALVVDKGDDCQAPLAEIPNTH